MSAIQVLCSLHRDATYCPPLIVCHPNHGYYTEPKHANATYLETNGQYTKGSPGTNQDQARILRGYEVTTPRQSIPPPPIVPASVSAQQLKVERPSIPYQAIRGVEAVTWKS